MIVRVLGEGQFRVPDSELPLIQGIDEELEAAVASADPAATAETLTRLRDHLVSVAERVEDDFLGSSDIVIPYADATVDEVRELLNEDGLIPGTSDTASTGS